MSTAVMQARHDGAWTKGAAVRIKAAIRMSDGATAEGKKVRS